MILGRWAAELLHDESTLQRAGRARLKEARWGGVDVEMRWRKYKRYIPSRQVRALASSCLV
jgi:hypothetical protein